MAITAAAIDAEELMSRIGGPQAPCLLDVRRAEAFAQSQRVIAGARWRDHNQVGHWGPRLDPAAEVVVVCVHGHNVSQMASARLRLIGLKARYLQGGIEGFMRSGGTTVARMTWPHGLSDGPSRWVTRATPTIGSLACSWFIRRFLDPAAEFIYVEPDWVVDVAGELEAEPFDVDGVIFGRNGGLCSYDSLLDHYGVEDQALRRLARIVRGADSALSDLEPQCAGLLALADGLSGLHGDDLVVLDHGIGLFDGLYAWARQSRKDARAGRPESSAA